MYVRSKFIFLTLIAKLLLHPSFGLAQEATPPELNELSETFLSRVRDGQDTKGVRDRLADLSLEDLEQGLTDDDRKLAFWINIYNAYIQHFLQEKPSLYDDRRSFFSMEEIPIGGERISFEKIEHGIIRKSQSPLGMGYVSKLFPDEFERRLRVEEPDYRIHFALNCGAKDCPPVAIYRPDRIREQLETGTKRHLRKTSRYDKSKKEVYVTALFSWFRGDFGGKDGTKEILKKFDIIPSTEEVDIEYTSYDWTLDLDNWTNP